MHNNSILLFDKYATEFFKNQPDAKVLEIGPDRNPSTFKQRLSWTGVWDTLDLHTYAQPTYVAADPYLFPIRDRSYDIVFNAQVIEHVPCIWRWMPELSRVCRREGTVITINPVSWEYHTAPVDCWRIYPDGMKALYQYANMRTVLSVFESLDSEHPDVIDTITIGVVK